MLTAVFFSLGTVHLEGSGCTDEYKRKILEESAIKQHICFNLKVRQGFKECGKKLTLLYGAFNPFSYRTMSVRVSFPLRYLF